MIRIPKTKILVLLFILKTDSVFGIFSFVLAGIFFIGIQFIKSNEPKDACSSRHLV